MNFTTLSFLLLVLVGLFANMAVAQTRCKTTTQVRCNIRCRSVTPSAKTYMVDPVCTDELCNCTERPKTTTTPAPEA
ncbi:putative defensin 5 precursor [Anopheles sinensis]|uniref:Putative defensin 5 n=1 Tax=Anopheles sinensis TaxID=74873 RepID=A0A084VC60_ANOSI|nr:putative defensin 5 precursor [Anopheles sinensis]